MTVITIKTVITEITTLTVITITIVITKITITITVSTTIISNYNNTQRFSKTLLQVKLF